MIVALPLLQKDKARKIGQPMNFSVIDAGQNW
jgi:hypothetical protein